MMCMSRGVRRRPTRGAARRRRRHAATPPPGCRRTLTRLLAIVGADLVAAVFVGGLAVVGAAGHVDARPRRLRRCTCGRVARLACSGRAASRGGAPPRHALARRARARAEYEVPTTARTAWDEGVTVYRARSGSAQHGTRTSPRSGVRPDRSGRRGEIDRRPADDFDEAVFAAPARFGRSAVSDGFFDQDDRAAAAVDESAQSSFIETGPIRSPPSPSQPTVDTAALEHRHRATRRQRPRRHADGRAPLGGRPWEPVPVPEADVRHRSRWRRRARAGADVRAVASAGRVRRRARPDRRPRGDSRPSLGRQRLSSRAASDTVRHRLG